MVYLHLCIVTDAVQQVLRRDLNVDVHSIGKTSPTVRKVSGRRVGFLAFYFGKV
jgi:hypothetical protein